MKKSLLVLLGFIILGGAYVWFFVYNKSHRDIATEEIAYVVEAEALYTEFYENQQTATAKYSNKVIAVTGEILTSEGRQILMYPGILCVLDSSQANTFNPGLIVEFRGRVSGFDDLFGEIRLDFCSEVRE